MSGIAILYLQLVGTISQTPIEKRAQWKQFGAPRVLDQKLSEVLAVLWNYYQYSFVHPLKVKTLTLVSQELVSFRFRGILAFSFICSFPLQTPRFIQISWIFSAGIRNRILSIFLCNTGHGSQPDRGWALAGFWTELHPRASFLFPVTAGSLQVQAANLAKFYSFLLGNVCAHIDAQHQRAG